MKAWAYSFVVIGSLAILFGFGSCYQTLTHHTPQLYPGSGGSDGKRLAGIERSWASILAGAVVLTVGIYIGQRHKFR
jgi:hypothetical protein